MGSGQMIRWGSLLDQNLDLNLDLNFKMNLDQNLDLNLDLKFKLNLDPNLVRMILQIHQFPWFYWFPVCSAEAETNTQSGINMVLRTRRRCC